MLSCHTRRVAAACVYGLVLQVSLAQAVPQAVPQPGAQARAVSGPQTGAKLPACAVHAPSGAFAGRDFDVAAQVGDAPAALLFVQELTRNTAPIITGLDQLGTEWAWTGLQVHTIRIAADRNEAEAAIKRSSAALKLRRPMLVSTDGVDGPGGYALSRQAALTLVLAKQGTVVRSMVFTDTGRGDLGRLRELVQEVTGVIPTDPEALRLAMAERLTHDPEQLRAMLIDLAVQMQRMQEANQRRAGDSQAMRPGGRAAMGRDAQPGGQAAQGQNRPPSGKPREGKAPEDAELLALLRRAIQKAADAAELDQVFQAVETRVGSDSELRKQAVAMFKLQVSLEYGNEDSLVRARAYIEKHGLQ